MQTNDYTELLKNTCNSLIQHNHENEKEPGQVKCKICKRYEYKEFMKKEKEQKKGKIITHYICMECLK